MPDNLENRFNPIRIAAIMDYMDTHQGDTLAKVIAVLASQYTMAEIRYAYRLWMVQ